VDTSADAFRRGRAIKMQAREAPTHPKANFRYFAASLGAGG